MKKIFLLSILLYSTAIYAGKAPEKAVDIYIDVNSYVNDTIVLGYYYNDKMLARDTAITNDKGVAHFSHDEKYPEGIYMVYIPGKTYFDILMSADQTFTLHCDTNALNIVKRVKIEGCTQLQDFLDFQNFLAAEHKEMQQITKDYSATADTTEKSVLRNQYKEHDEIIKRRNEYLIEKYNDPEDNFLSVFLTALKDVDVPKYEELDDSTRQSKRYYYYRDHYFDNIPLDDDRILRTPFLVSKIDKFFDEVVLQHPDTAAVEAIKLIEKTRGNKDCFQFFTSHLYNYFNTSKVMGMDAALVAIADKYYLSGVADWVEEDFVKDLRETIDCLRHCLVNRKCEDLPMVGINGERFRLHEVDAPYTILVFWEPSCGHCQKEIPKLKEQVWDKYQKEGIKIFAVYCQVEREEWENFIEKHQLEDWINVYDPYGRSNFRKYYNIKSTPQIFILDREKTIIAKKIGVEQIPDFLDYMLAR